MVTSLTFNFFLDNVVLGKLQINKNFIALYLPCMDIILLFDIAQVKNIGVSDIGVIKILERKN